MAGCAQDQVIASQPTSFDMFRPECNEYGGYRAMQCFEHKRYGKWCWCVDIKGQEIIGSKVVDNDGNSGNLTESKCEDLRKDNGTKEYWTAFYRHSTTTPVPIVATTVKPIVVVNSSTGECKSKNFYKCVFLLLYILSFCLLYGNLLVQYTLIH